jgi:hypothetical protein
MTGFDDKLKAAIDRGVRKGKKKLDDEAQKQANEEEMRRLHTKYRLSVSEYIEGVVKKLADYFPGFRFETVFGDSGWGAACWRDELVVEAGRRSNRYSRFEMAIRSVNQYFVLDLQARGTIANRELLTRSFYAPLDEVDEEHFNHLVDTWALAFAELYSSQSV